MNNNNNIVGGRRDNAIISLTHHTFPINQMRNVMGDGILDRFLIGEGIIPYNFNYNDNVEVSNVMIIDKSENRFIYDNRDLRLHLYNAVMDNLNVNNNIYHVICFRNIEVNADYPDDIRILIGRMLNGM